MPPKKLSLALLVTLLTPLVLSSPVFAQASSGAVPSQQSALPTDSASAFSVRSTPAWSHADERWFRTNRRIATTGKVLTVVGRIAVIATLAAGAEPFSDPEYWGALSVASTGELMWSIADLRALNRLVDRGAPARRGAGITSLVGAVTLAPLTWIAGPIASARIRAAHADLIPASSMNAPPAVSVRGASLTVRF